MNYTEDYKYWVYKALTEENEYGYYNASSYYILWVINITLQQYDAKV